MVGSGGWIESPGLSSDKLYKYALQRLGRDADDMNFYGMLFSCRKST
jgi:hypothetical protein